MHSKNLTQRICRFSTRMLLFICIFRAVISLSAETLPPARICSDNSCVASADYDAFAANSSGMLFLEQGNNLKAEESFRLVIVLLPSSAAGYNNLAASLMRQKRFAEACPYLEKAVQLDPNHVKAAANLSIALFHCGEYRAAYQRYCEAKMRDEAYIKTRFTRKKTLEELSRKAKENPARTEFSRMTEYIEKNPELLD